MNIAKNMEIIFVTVAVIAGATSFATAADAPAIMVRADSAVARVATVNADMPVVTVTAKRLTAAEKAAL
ncbi:hypothetical protein SAMN05428959_104153 [Duganella sp. CF517]|uniref:hypothetical protein n=1 Tax=Duganella sp. CF517 TaxID=1881038 RepID=UPI0008C0845F|nr:hypothetical protein [Duganella sp. CF517]SEO00765.1 hypothetical protein SAMN05428959_104153 [Duganella sp. CF517]